MDYNEFWQIIETTRQHARGDDERQLESLRDQLRLRSVAEIESFDEHFEACRARADHYDLWAAATIIDGYWVSDDGFADFRSWLIAQGREAFENALRDPQSLAQVTTVGQHCEFEEFAYIASSVWEEKTGRDAQYMPNNQAYLSGDPAGQPWENDAELQQRFPELYARFAREHDDDDGD